MKVKNPIPSKISYWSALSVKKFRYVSYGYIPAGIFQNGVCNIYIEGVQKVQIRRQRLGPEILHMADMMGASLVGEYRTLYETRVVCRINGQLSTAADWKEIESLKKKAETFTF